MDREIVLAVLVLAVVAPLTMLGSLRRNECGATSARDLERSRWDALFRPLVPAAVVLAALLGWALTEPDDAEPVSIRMLFVIAPFALVWARALVRAIRALRRLDGVVAGTIGLLRPRIVLAPELARALSPAALDAARAHEAAHARHRDPFRIWLAQIATDLQWPWAAAGERFSTWLEALELARDEEAREHGVDGTDLAAAVLAAVELAPAVGGAIATLHGPEEALRQRIARLLAPVPGRTPAPAPLGRAWVLGSMLATAAGCGAFFGESVIRALLGG